MIGGLSGVGNLMTMVSWMQQIDPAKMYVNMGKDLDPSVAMGSNTGVQVPGVDFNAMRQAMLNMQTIKQELEQRDQQFAERGEKRLEEKKAILFEDNHYEWPNGENADPVLVSGGETTKQTNQRERWEQRRLEELQDRKAAEGSGPPEGSARARLQALMSDSAQMQALAAQPGGQRYVQELNEAAQVEEQIQGVRDRADELMATMPPSMRGDVISLREDVLDQCARSRAQLAASPDAQAVKAYQDAVQDWVTKQQSALAAAKEQNWQPYTAKTFQV